MPKKATHNHYFDNSGLYTYSLPCGEGDCPPDSSRKSLPPTPWPVGHWPSFDRKTQAWTLVRHLADAAPQTSAPEEVSL